MELNEIKEAVAAGYTVHYQSDAYVVKRDRLGQWLIVCIGNQYTIGLTWANGTTMNGRPEDFFIGE